MIVINIYKVIPLLESSILSMGQTPTICTMFFQGIDFQLLSDVAPCSRCIP